MTKAEKTKAYIIEKTAPIFNKKGFAGTSLNDMTAATGLTKGSIYGNFANKDEVALAVFDYNLKKLTDIINSDLSAQKGARNKLLVYAERYERFLNPPFTEGGCPVLNTAVEADDTHAGLRTKATEAILSWKKTIVKIIEKGIVDKEFKPDTDAEQIAFTMIAMTEGSMMIAKLLDNKQYVTMVLQSMKKMIQSID
ncbi:MAG: TetR/AcrR family transcriptional regulator [Pedobacter sp.]|jgi:AcrR family transcriptional regulator|uniref:TetR/AcrR family transcriptional regulator n=1 Tax=Pedobacter sp. TaxID=1411316 RepID=UPI003567A698